MRSEDESHAILTSALSSAQADEADAVFVSVDRNISRFAGSNVHQNMSEVSAGLTLRVVVNGATGVASTSSFDPDEIARTAAVAREAARHAQASDRFTGLVRDTSASPDLETWDEATAAMNPRDKALSLRAMFDRGRAAGVEFAGAFATSSASVACANSHGVRRYCRMTAADATVIALQDALSGYATGCSRRAADVDIAALGEEATFKTLLCSDKLTSIQTGEYDVILEPPALAEVFEWLGMIAFTGQAYDEGSSFFAGKIGERVAGENVTIADDSVDETFLPFPFDLEGMPKSRVPLIERGIARTPVLDKAYADRLDFPPTGNAWSLGSPDHGSAFHVSLDGGDATREDMIASMERGIWVTRFNYVNGLLEPKTATMTGMTRDGTFLIRDGKVAGRMPNLRWTHSIVEALSNIVALTKERRRIATWYNMFGGTIAPTVKVRGWRFE